jgi:16S rRNA (cytidine1402-2'-O)-methyltransferase
VIAPPDAESKVISSDVLDEKLIEALTSHTLKDATDAVVADTGMKRRDVYQRALALTASREKAK